MKKFLIELNQVQDRLVEMGHLTESMVALMTDLLLGEANDVFDALQSREERLDKMQLEIDSESVRLLTVYSPVAADLRYLITVMHVNSTLERIGDLTCGLCADVQLLHQQNGRDHPLPLLRQMAATVNTMVRGALDAFVARNAQAAMEVMSRDDLVDSMNDQAIRELLSDEMVREVLKNPEHAAEGLAKVLAQILVSRSLERLGDQAVHICEDVIYMVKGDDIRHSIHPAE